jgi:hypothetical protein
MPEDMPCPSLSVGRKAGPQTHSAHQARALALATTRDRAHGICHMMPPTREAQRRRRLHDQAGECHARPWGKLHLLTMRRQDTYLETRCSEMEMPRHKLSDSHSSVSSFASSSFSASHSRMSSATTVNGYGADLPSPPVKLGQLPACIEVPTLGSVHPPSPGFPGQAIENVLMDGTRTTVPSPTGGPLSARSSMAGPSNKHLSSLEGAR